MSLNPIAAHDALTLLDQFDARIDARSESEFALDHLPGAVNWPTLDDVQRQQIGTMYAQINPFEARKRGAILAARNIADHVERHVLQQAKDWRPLTYCWRGGQRSGALSLILSQIGFRVSVIEGGYKAFRAAMLAHMGPLVGRLNWRVIRGPTGSGKTRLLQALAQVGAQVLDLEQLAQHRSSVLGALPGQAQPSQKRFDTLIWDAVRQFDPQQPVYVESESKKVGNVTVPTELLQAMRASPCLDLHLPDQERVALLLEDYDWLVRDGSQFCDRLETLTALRGRNRISQWQAQVRAGDLLPVVCGLLLEHYDPAYHASMQRNFSHFSSARKIELPDRSRTTLHALAQQLLAEAKTPTSNS